jgi:hypothetical protein
MPAAEHPRADMDFDFTSPTLSIALPLPSPTCITDATIKAAGGHSKLQAGVVSISSLCPCFDPMLLDVPVWVDYLQLSTSPLWSAHV